MKMFHYAKLYIHIFVTAIACPEKIWTEPMHF